MHLIFVLIYFCVSVLAILLWPNKTLSKKNVALFFLGGFLGLITTLLVTLLLPVLQDYLYLVFPLISIAMSINLLLLFDLIEQESERALFYRMPYSVIFSSLAANILALFFVELVHQGLLGAAFSLSFKMAYLTTPLLLLIAVNISCAHQQLTIKQFSLTLLIVPVAALLSFVNVALGLMSMLWCILAVSFWFALMRYRQIS